MNSNVCKWVALLSNRWAFLWWGYLLSWGWMGQAAAQQHWLWNNQRVKRLAVVGDTLKIDSLSILPGTIRIAGIADSCYQPYELEGYLVWKCKPPTDSVWVSYRVFHEALGAPVFFHKPDAWRQGFALNHPYTPEAGQAASEGFFPGRLQYNGSLGRSISFGNTQSVILRSALNLQVSGYLGDSIQVQAAVSDQQLPVQPAGNTLTLQDLDQVYVRFIRRPYQLQVGDFDLMGRTYFMRFYKRLQGMEISKGMADTGLSSGWAFRIAGAVSRGIQARNVFQGQEGNQGPYPLHGNQGETPITVLAGTERVYLDGQLLQRGEDQDYVIDYNTGQISFTPRRLITKDSRIQVEFEYANQHYVNTQWYAEANWQATPRLQLDMHVYSNTDNKRAPLLQPLDASQQLFLRRIGNQVDQAFYPDAVPDTSLTQHVLYRRIDTLVNGIWYDSVFLYSTDGAADTLYNVSFSYVGPGKGDYVLGSTLANGRVYMWVAPVNGMHQGDYVAAVLLVAPRSQQLISLHVRTECSSHSMLEGEWAWSQLNVNTFAPPSASVQQGMAAHLSFQDQRSLGRAGGKPIPLNTQLNYDFVSHGFQALQPFREVEFNRAWSLPLDSVLAPADEHLLSFSTGISRSKGWGLQYAWQGYWRLGQAADPKLQLQGNSHQLTLRYLQPDFHATSQATLTRVSSPFFVSTLWKPQIVLSKFWQGSGTSQWELTTSWNQEKNAMHLQPVDTLSPGSYDFQITRLDLSRASQDNRVGISTTYRLDRAPHGYTGFGMGSISKTIRLYGDVNRPMHQLQWNIAYRSVEVRDSQFLFHQDSSFTSQDAGSQLMGQLVDHIAVGGWIDHHLLYGLAGGQQQQLAFTYVPVPAGQGQYVWVDYNHDGIPQVNEFQPAVFADQGNYVRIFTPTQTFIPTRLVQWDEQLSIHPSKWGESSCFLLQWLTQMRLESHLNISLQRAGNKGPLVNPFKRQADATLLGRQSLMSHSIFLQPHSGVWSADYTLQAIANRNFMIYGQESHITRQHIAHARLFFLSRYEFSIAWEMGRMLDSIDQVMDQRYDYRFRALTPMLQYISGSAFRVSLAYGYNHKRNRQAWGGETYTGQSLTGTCTWSQLSATRLECSLSFNHVQFSGNTQSPAGFSMLQGLLPGTNWLWHLGLIRRLAGNLEINLDYDGRKTGSARIVHTGTATLRAVF